MTEYESTQDWRKAGSPPSVIASCGSLAPVALREVGGHRVMDVLRDKSALVVCVQCGATWEEGAQFVNLCCARGT